MLIKEDYVDKGGGGVRTLDAATGKSIWKLKPRGLVKSTPMVADGTVFTIAKRGTNTEIIIASDATTSNEQWRADFSTAVNHPRVHIETVDSDSVYITKPHTDGTSTYVAALNRADGSERWGTYVPQSSEGVPGDGVARVGDHLYVGGAVLDPTGGTIIKTWKAPSEDWMLSAVAGRRAYLSNTQTQNWMLTALTGTANQPTQTPTQTSTQQQTTTTASPTETGTSAPSTTASSPTETETQSPDSESTDAPTPTPADQTTATNGPGFGGVAAIAGIGLGAWRYIKQD